MRSFVTDDTKSDLDQLEVQKDLSNVPNFSAPFEDLISKQVSVAVSSAIIGDATYRVKELIQVLTMFTVDSTEEQLKAVNQVLERMNYPVIFSLNESITEFWNIGGVLIENDPDNLCSAVLNDGNTFQLSGGLFIKNELIMGRGEDGNVGHLPETLTLCYDSIRAILCGCNEQHFRSLALSLRSNSLLGPILPYVVDDMAEQIKLANGREAKLYCLFDIVNTLISNQFVNLSKSVSINKLMASLLSVAFSSNQGKDDDLRRKFAEMLGRSMLRWPNILLVREVLHKLNKCLQDSLLPLQVQRGALHILATMGNASLALVLWPLLLNRPTYGVFLDAIRSKPELSADYAAIQDTLLVCSLALQGFTVGVDIPIKNVASVASAGCPDAIYHLLCDLMGDDVMCCRWPVPKRAPRLLAVKVQAQKNVSLAMRATPSRARQRQQMVAQKAPSQRKQKYMVMVIFKVARQTDVRRQRLQQKAFSSVQSTRSAIEEEGKEEECCSASFF
ncbi:uncharacterized protein LOC132199492 [Neocloeon triangulifer]|uniref:uncharacterized protein LOC132199492 n=1 Tax=Neocloeon triangulifer TaxID=2078957 RepID=UPI00286F7EAD|nr:uncharacterized protein LOC132199492 [Neocloeon triangulifer]XP_059480247.1 uncharacterized protein LOC132199492 [Neocloeon triangulifer]XP_059480248.1 uncharacterized protein LOC132199492 [Neocloeon triangulifer]XP_059480249.1 uncharacterized protein LOC132199492 [Neocloeon triangulifer]XP_059480250.1 uncharacterized protein LOC132199492 [Neocloeon triangulifer]XP_059480251.1 uncharacterized protein LOC132199492 [Neocloeon triangulifer]XP_059480252.1 uncharacterized protein LOC132199492 [